MAKKKRKKKAAKKKAAKKKKVKKPTSKRLDLDALLEELSEAQKELNRMQRRLQGLRTLCRRPRVLKD